MNYSPESLRSAQESCVPAPDHCKELLAKLRNHGCQTYWEWVASQADHPEFHHKGCIESAHSNHQSTTTLKN